MPDIGTDLLITSATQMKSSHQQIDVLAQIGLRLFSHVSDVRVRAARDQHQTSWRVYDQGLLLESFTHLAR